MRRFIGTLFLGWMVLFATLYAESPNYDKVAKLYVATFNRAPDSAGINYWLHDSGLSLEGIAQSFFDQPETQEKYPSGTTARTFIQSVYRNLFNRDPDQRGWDYWEHELQNGRIPRSTFILAVINGAQDTSISEDATILEHKKEVGVAFAHAKLNDVAFAKEIMRGVDASRESVENALHRIASIVQYPAKLFPSVDEEALLENDSLQSLQTEAPGAVVQTQPVSGAVELSASLLLGKNGSTLTLDGSSSVGPEKVGEPLFVDGIFSGIIQEVVRGSSHVKVRVGNAENPYDVYAHFDLQTRNEGFVSNRSLVKLRMICQPFLVQRIRQILQTESATI